MDHSLPGTFAPESENGVEHSLPNAKSKTWSFRSPCFQCVFLSKVTMIASSMLNRYTYLYAVAVSYNLLIQTYSCKISLSRAGTQHQIDKRIEKKLLPDA